MLGVVACTGPAEVLAPPGEALRPDASGSLTDASGRHEDLAPADGGPDALGPPRCPAEMSLVAVAAAMGTPDSLVCVDRYEAATVQELPDGTTKPWPFDRPVDGMTVRAAVAHGLKPQAFISGTQAQAACQRAGKRLCTASEWRAACQGSRGYTYPYGNTYVKGACNEGRTTNPVNDCFGSGSDVFNSKNMNDPCCVNKPNTVAVGGAFPMCKTAEDLYDMHGNLHEWVDGTSASGKGIFQGGFFVDAKLNGPGCLYRTTAHDKSYHDYSTGFRCCTAPVR